MFFLDICYKHLLGIISWPKIHIDYRSNSYRDIVDRAGRQVGARREVGWAENKLAVADFWQWLLLLRQLLLLHDKDEGRGGKGQSVPRYRSNVWLAIDIAISAYRYNP